MTLLGACGLCAAAWRRARGGRGGSGRVVVRGRNYEANIRKVKGPADLLKVKIANKHLKQIILAVRERGPDESTNDLLKRCIKAAVKDNVKRSTIDNRIKKFVETKEAIDDFNMSANVNGAGVVVECVTDNTARCRAEVRKCFTDLGFEISSNNANDHLFNKLGVITYTDVDEETVVEAAMEADVEDCEAKEDGSVEVLTLPENVHTTVATLEEQDLEPSSAEVKYMPTVETQLNDNQTYEFKSLLWALNECDDVQDIHHNAILTDKELEMDTYGRPKKLKNVGKQ